MVRTVGQLSAAESVYSISASGAIAPISTGQLGSGFVLLDANVSFSFPSGSPTYMRQRITLQQSTIGGWVASFPANVTWVGGSEPTPPLRPNDFSTYEFISSNGGIAWIGMQIITPTAPKIYDLFTRADSAASLGSAPIGGAWTAHTGTFGVLNAAAYLPTLVGDSVASIDTTLANHSVFSDIVFGSTAAQPGIVGRVADANNYWLALPSQPVILPQSISLWKRVAGAYTNINTINLSNTPYIGSNSTRLGLVFSGNNITVYVNGTSIITATDAALNTNTRVGLRLNDASSGNNWDNFVAF